MTKSRGINTPRFRWTTEQDAVLMRRYPNEKAQKIADDLGVGVHVVYSRANRLHLTKSEQFLTSSESGRLEGIRGSATRFQPGNVPWTKGVKGLRLSPATEFKKGDRPINYMQVGSEKMHMDYVWIKIQEGGWPDAWRPKHHVIYEQHNGIKPPPGFLVSFKDRDRANFAPDNLELISRADWMKRHTRHNLPKDLADLIALQGALTRQINKRSNA